MSYLQQQWQSNSSLAKDSVLFRLKLEEVGHVSCLVLVQHVSSNQHIRIGPSS